MKRLALALALLLAPSLAWGQCSGVFPNNTVCGNATGSSNTPRAVSATSLPAGPITVGSTVVASGTSLRVLYDNIGTLGEYTNTQLTALINAATASLSGALPAWPNNITTFFRGDGTYQTLNCAALSGVAASCATDATNASNISSGTLAASRMAAFGSGDVSFATAGGSGTIANNAVTNAKAAQGAANTIKGNWTGSTANLSDNAMPSCADTAGNHLNYVSGTGITCGTTTTGSAVVLLATLTCPNSSTDKCADTTSLTATYSSYKLVFESVIPATNGTTCELQIHSGGAFKATGYVTSVEGHIANGAANQPSNTTFIQCSYTLGAYNGDPGVNGEITIYNPSASSIHVLQGNFTSANSSSAVARTVTYGYWNTSGVVDGFQVFFSSGNITSGTIKIYGVL